MLLSLLKMINVQAGSVLVHGLNIMHAPVAVVREMFFVTIPQDAVLFNHASLRFNLDPSETLGNDTIMDSIEKVGLSRHFNIDRTEDSDRHEPTNEYKQGHSDEILCRPLSSLPQLSAGQMQLLALGRALLQAHHIADHGYQPIILLDEATSSLDIETERLMLSVIREEFLSKDYTIIMVAHRLGALKGIMREGTDKIVEL